MLIEFSAEDLPKVLKRGDRVAVMWRAASMVIPSSAKLEQVQGTGAQPSHDVLWNVFTPSQSNQFAFDDGAPFTAFASTVPPAIGNVLQLNTTRSIVKGTSYSYAAGQFTAGAKDYPQRFALSNASGGNVTLGLAHGASVNGTQGLHPTCAVGVGNGQQVLLTPGSHVRVCMVRGGTSGSIFPPIGSGVATVALADVETAVLTYDIGTNAFDVTP